jgi:hypothetical protein
MVAIGAATAVIAATAVKMLYRRISDKAIIAKCKLGEHVRPIAQT